MRQLVTIAPLSLHYLTWLGQDVLAAFPDLQSCLERTLASVIHKGTPGFPAAQANPLSPPSSAERSLCLITNSFPIRPGCRCCFPAVPPESCKERAANAVQCGLHMCVMCTVLTAFIDVLKVSIC